MTKNSIKIEWGWDMDDVRLRQSVFGYPEREFKLKGRCQRCWGCTIGRFDLNHRVTGIKCRECGQMLQGDAAAGEEDRIWREASHNALNLVFGLACKYDTGAFAFKVFPPLERHTEEDLKTRIAMKSTRHPLQSKRKKLTREEFPPGAPGMLLLQAAVLMAGMGHGYEPDQHSVADFWPSQLNYDGSLTVSPPVDELKQDPRYEEYRMLGRMGATLVSSMVSAFACELVMKAISLTCNDEGNKTHDLRTLFEDLPQECQQRVESDYPDIVEILGQARHIFGDWRYFEMSVGEKAFAGMIDSNRERALAKAARVLMDEALMVGLSWSVNMDAKSDVKVSGSTRSERHKIKVNLKSWELPPQ